MCPSTKWVKKTEALAGETLASFLGHFARDNFFDSRRALLHALNVPPAIRLHASELHRLADLLGIDGEILEQMAPSRAPAVPALRLAFTRARSDPICPKCLKEASYSRRLWSHYLATACPEHCVQLVEHCPACGALLQHDRPLAHICECGQDLRSVKAVAAAALEIEVATLLDGRTPAHLTLPLDLSRGVPADIDLFLLGLMKYFGAESTDARSLPHPGQAAAPRSVVQAGESLAALARMIRDWPETFSRTVADLLRAAPQRGRSGLSVRLGSWYSFLFNRFRNPAYEGFRTVAANTIVLAHEGRIDTRSRDLLSACTVEKTDWISLTEAARELGVSGFRLAKGVDDGRILGFVPETGYRRRSMTRLELERLRSIRDDHCDNRFAAAFLGVPASVFAILAEAGLVKIDDAAALPPVTRGYVRRAQLQELADHLFAKLDRVDEPNKEHLALRDLSLRRTTHRQRLIDLCRSIGDGSFAAVGHDGTGLVGGILFSKRQVRERVASFSAGVQLNTQQISQLTGAHYRSVKAWMRAGVLPARGGDTKADPLLVDLSDLVHFLLEYSPLSCLASQMSSTSRGVATLLARKQVSLAIESDRVGLLVRVTDLIRAKSD
jgi:hypothetical protein